MTTEEIERAIKHFRLKYQIGYTLLPIIKENLIVGQKYLGVCRNSDVAIWNGEQFEYKRNKFGSTFTEKINHFEDDDGYDVFVPFMEFEL